MKERRLLNLGTLRLAAHPSHALTEAHLMWLAGSKDCEAVPHLPRELVSWRDKHSVCLWRPLYLCVIPCFGALFNLQYSAYAIQTSSSTTCIAQRVWLFLLANGLSCCLLLRLLVCVGPSLAMQGNAAMQSCGVGVQGVLFCIPSIPLELSDWPAGRSWRACGALIASAGSTPWQSCILRC